MSAARLSLALAAATIASLAAAPGALGASTLTYTFGSLDFNPESGVANKVTVSSSPKLVTISDSEDTIATAIPSCAGSGTNQVECSSVGLESDFTRVGISLDGFVDNNNDTLTASGSVEVSGFGGEGNDTLTGLGPGPFEGIGGDGNDTVKGGPGPDFLTGDDGVDTVSGGGGHDAIQGGEGIGDTVNGGGGNDLIVGGLGDGGGDQQNGGPGFDQVFYLTLLGIESPPDYSVNLGAGSISAGGETDALVSVEDAMTFQGADTVTGSAGANSIVTATDEETLLTVLGGLGVTLPIDAGDTVNPLGGPDFVKTGANNDIVNLVDGSADRLDCGSGTDIVEADQLDELINCEKVTKSTVTPVGSSPSPPPAPVDGAAPSCSLKGVAGSYQRKAFLRGLRPSVACNEPVSLEAELTTPAKAKRGGKKANRRKQRAGISRAGDLVLAEASSAAAGAVRLQLPGRLRALLGPSFKATLRIVARDKAGNATVLQRVIRVKPDAKKGKGKKKG